MGRKFVIQIPEVRLKIIKIIALRPMVREIVQVTQELSVRFFPVGDLRFHRLSLTQEPKSLTAKLFILIIIFQENNTDAESHSSRILMSDHVLHRCAESFPQCRAAFFFDATGHYRP